MLDAVVSRSSPSSRAARFWSSATVKPPRRSCACRRRRGGLHGDRRWIPSLADRRPRSGLRRHRRPGTGYRGLGRGAPAAAVLVNVVDRPALSFPTSSCRRWSIAVMGDRHFHQRRSPVLCPQGSRCDRKRLAAEAGPSRRLARQFRGACMRASCRWDPPRLLGAFFEDPSPETVPLAGDERRAARELIPRYQRQCAVVAPPAGENCRIEIASDDPEMLTLKLRARALPADLIIQRRRYRRRCSTTRGDARR